MHTSFYNSEIHSYLKLMANNESNDTTTVGTAFTYTTSFQLNQIKFWILLSLQLLSIPCFLYVFYQFATKRKLRQTTNNHVILLLLIISFLFVTVALSLSLAYLYTSQVYPSDDTFCSLWNWFHYSINIINELFGNRLITFLVIFDSFLKNLFLV